MKTLSFLAIVLTSGLLGGLIHGFANIVLVEPYLDNAIGIENQRMFASGEAQNTPQFWEKFSDYRIWQKQGSIVAGAMLGVATGALFDIIWLCIGSGTTTEDEDPRDGAKSRKPGWFIQPSDRR